MSKTLRFFTPSVSKIVSSVVDSNISHSTKFGSTVCRLSSTYGPASSSTSTTVDARLRAPASQRNATPTASIVNISTSHCSRTALGLRSWSASYLPSRHLHSKSEGDEQFVEFLKQEIEGEKKESVSLPTVTGFNIETEGPNVKLSKRANGECVTVEFSVNHSLSSTEDSEISDQSQELSSPEIMSNPPFTVTIEKDGQPQKLSVRCQLIELPEDVADGDEPDAYEIMDVAMLDNEWNDKVYSVDSEVVDGTMYDMLMLMLEQRGVDHSKFVDELVQFATAYEQKQYIQLLESIKNFMSN